MLRNYEQDVKPKHLGCIPVFPSYLRGKRREEAGEGRAHDQGPSTLLAITILWTSEVPSYMVVTLASR